MLCRYSSAALLVVLAFVLSIARLRGAGTDTPAAISTGDFAITAIAVQGTNLMLTTVIPAGVGKVVLEMCPALNAAWEDYGTLDVPSGGGEAAFNIPKPTNAMAFFRLRGQRSAESTPLVSAEARYVTMPSLGADAEDGGDAVFHFKGQVDGSDKIVITREGAFWSHVNWGWPPEAVAINGTQWNPNEKNYLTTVGTSKFLPDTFSLESVDLDIKQGRDVVALERTTNAMIVYIDDTPGGPGDYEFGIHFHPAGAKPRGTAHGLPARLNIAARIDGSDRIKITAEGAVWEHQAWSPPTDVALNKVCWSPAKDKILKNEGTNRFLPPGVDFSTAKIVRRKGRDLATMRAEKDAVWVWFADNPNGTDLYELVISFGE